MKHSARMRHARRKSAAGRGAEDVSARDQPLEEAQKSYHTILEQHVEQAEEELHRPALGLLLSGLSAGLDIGFGPLLMAVILTLGAEVFSRPVTELLMAGAYGVGFVFVVIGRSALFTEQTTSAVLPVLSGRAGPGELLRLWGLVLLANVLGTVAMGALIAGLGPRLGVVTPAALGEIAGKLLSPSWGVMLLSAILAGWLMGLLSWLVIAARETFSQIVAVFLTTFVIGACGFHHVIAGSVEVLMALFAGAGPTWREYGVFLFWAALGNAIGGAVFVALLKSGHVRASRR